MFIEVERDSIVIENQRVKRPTRITRSDWMRYWENVKYGLDETTGRPPDPVRHTGA